MRIFSRNMKRALKSSLFGLLLAAAVAVQASGAESGTSGAEAGITGAEAGTSGQGPRPQTERRQGLPGRRTELPGRRPGSTEIPARIWTARRN